MDARPAGSAPASRTLRAIAKGVDWSLMGPFWALCMVAFVRMIAGRSVAISLRSPLDVVEACGGWWNTLLLATGLLGGLLLGLYQWYLLGTRGQTLGKRVCGIAVVALDGSRAGFVRAVLLREWLANVVFLLPYVGLLLWLANLVPMFAPDRRCAHDHVAGTHVVVVRPPGRLRLLFWVGLLSLASLLIAWRRPDLLRALRAWIAPDRQAHAAAPPAGRPERDDPALSAWLARLEDPEPRVRWTAIRSVAPVSSEARPRVVRALVARLERDDHFLVRADAAGALGALGPDAREATPALERAQGDVAAAVRDAATAALARVR